MTGTSFSSRQWCEKDDSANRNYLTEKEKLEEACWNGLLAEIFPDMFGNSASAKLLYLWQTRQAASFIELELGKSPVTIDKAWKDILSIYRKQN